MQFWCQDEARVGQKGRGTRVWYERGLRPEGIIDHRYASAWLYAAVRPGTDEAFALVIPEVSAGAMQAFLDGFAATLPQAVHAALLLDGTGWHTADAITVPANVSLIFLPHLRTETEPGGADLALPARALPLAPALRRSRGRHRRLLRRLEPPRRGARPRRLPDRPPAPAVGQDFMSRV